MTGSVVAQAKSTVPDPSASKSSIYQPSPGTGSTELTRERGMIMTVPKYGCAGTRKLAVLVIVTMFATGRC